jgi:hypothetical protein
LEPIGRDFGIDPAKTWEAEYEWLDLLNVEQLRDLVPQLDHTEAAGVDGWTKADLIERVLSTRAKSPEVRAMFSNGTGG